MLALTGGESAVAVNLHSDEWVLGKLLNGLIKPVGPVLPLKCSHDLLGGFESSVDLLVLAPALGGISSFDELRHLLEYFTGSSLSQ